MAFQRRNDPWGSLQVQRFDPICAGVAKDFKLDDLPIYKIYDSKSFMKGARIAFVYESDEEDLPKILGRVVARSLLQHHTGELECVYAIKVADHKKYMDIICDQLYELNPDVVICVSRDIMRKLILPTAYSTVDPLQLINRIHSIGWQSDQGVDKYDTIISLPDDDVLLRTEEGKVAKESTTRLGEWVYATVAALRGKNLYTINMKNYKYKIVKTIAQFEEFMDELYKADIAAIDTETDNLNRIVNKTGTIQFSFTKDFAWIIPIYHPETPFSPKETAYILTELKQYFECGEPSLHIYCNAKFDLTQLFRDCKLKWMNHLTWDVQSAEYFLEENRKFRNVKKVNAVTGKDRLSPYALSQLVLEYGCTIYLEGNMGKDDRSAIFSTPLEYVAEYGGKDTVSIFQMQQFQMQEIKSRGPAYSRLPNLIKYQMTSMIRAFVEMERTGLPVDRFYLTKEVASGGAFLEARQKEREQIYATDACKKANDILVKKHVGDDLFGRTNNGMWVFDIDKTEHQCLLFFDVLKLEPIKIGKNGLPSTDKLFKDKYAPLDDSGKLLEEIAVPEVAMFRNYSELKHLYNSFLKGFYNKLFEDVDMRKDGRLRPQFSYLEIVTGRAGARKPSLQQVPSRSKLAKPIKRQFITPEGQLFVDSDFCLGGNTLIPTAKGIIAIKDMQSRDFKATVSGAGKIPVTAKNWWNNGVKPTLTITGHAGAPITCTKEHELLILDQNTGELTWVQAKDCRKGDMICLNTNKLVRKSPLVLNLSKANYINSNNTTGDTCVYPNPYTAKGRYPEHKRKNWQVRVRINGKQQYLGSYVTKEDAVEAARSATNKHGYSHSFRPISKPTKMTPALAYLIACIVAEGFFTLHEQHNKVCFTNGDRKYIKKYQDCMYKVFGLNARPDLNIEKGTKTVINGVNTVANRSCYNVYTRNNTLALWLSELGLYTQKGLKKGKTSSHYKRVPWSILQADEQSQLSYLAAYLEGDGTVDNKQHRLSWYSASQEMLNDLKVMLNTHGYFPYNSKLGIQLGREDSQHIWSKLRPYMVTKNLQPYDVATHPNAGVPAKYWNNILPVQRKILPYNTEATSAYMQRLHKRDVKAYDKLKYLMRLDNLRYVPITHISKGATQAVYDLTIDDKVHAFVANGFVVHNCSHEVRNWAIASDEINLVETYIKTMILKKQFRLLKTVADPKDWELQFKMLDLHRQNCRIFFGVEPQDVSKEMRGKVKTLVFGTVYGMSAIRLSITLKISEEEAQELIDTLFAKFPDGTLYITDTHERGMKYLVVVSGIGRVRHLWGYLHTNYGVYGAMDRRGVNSRIQSVASDEGFEGNYQTQRLRWELFHSQKLPLVFNIGNAVHDSVVTMTNIQTVPVASYLIEHGYTNCVHESYLENFGMDFASSVGIELDFDIGPSLGDVQGWNFRPEEMRRIVEESCKWQQDNLGFRIGKDVMSKFEDNLEMIYELRCAELRKMPDNGVGGVGQLLTKKLAKEVAL